MKVKVLSNINSGQFVAGDVTDMSDSEAEQLIEAGAVEAFTDEGVAPAPDPLPVTPQASEPVGTLSQPQKPAVEPAKPQKVPSQEQIAKDMELAEGSQPSGELPQIS